MTDEPNPVIEANRWSEGRLPGLIGLEVTALRHGYVAARLPIRPDLLAINGFLHGATVVGLADTISGYGAMASLPPGGSGFTTIELKANFMGTVRSGEVTCVATMRHGGRMTQVWDAEVLDPGRDRVIALFRCTQLILGSDGAG